MRFTRIVLLCSLVALVAVPAALAIRFTDDSYNMPTGVVGQAYSKQFDGAGGCGPALPYQYTLIAGSLPPGLSLSFSGLISGTPTQAGSWSFYVNLSDQNPPSASWCRPAEAQRQFTITVTGGAQPLAINQPTLPTKATVVGTAYSFQFTAAGGGTQTWSVQSGSLPAGITLSSSGLLSGAPTTAGDFTFTVKVSDGSRSATQTYMLSVVNPLAVTAREVPAAEVSRAFRLQLSATGGRPAYAWAVAPGAALPAGLVLDPASGVVSGVPSVDGTFPVKVAVTDSFGFATTVDLNLNIAAKLALAPKTAVAKIGQRVRTRLLASGGVLPRTWTVVRGTLPAGVHLGARTGQLLGSTKKVGTSRVVVQVKDALGAIARTTLVLRVRG